MLRRLTLRDFVIVTTLEVDFHPGYTALTGETGAGKSILIDAVQLALGGRGEAGVVREGAPRAEIGAEFDALPPEACAWLAEAGFEADGAGDSVLLRRVVDAQGKSRAWINGSAATLAQLKTLGEWLVDIHGQHAWQGLTRPASVRALLDAYAGLDTAPLAAAWTHWREAQALLDDARQRGADLERERERLSWQIGELARLGPGADEWPELNGEHQRLAHAQNILDALQRGLAALQEADTSALSLTDTAIVELEGVSEYDAELAAALEVLRSARAQLGDAAHTLQAALRRTELDPARLGELDARLSEWLGLARRYRRLPEELPALLDGWRSELATLDAASDLDGLTRRASTAQAAYQAAARAVSAARRQAAPRLGRTVTEAMQQLGMTGGRFEVALETLAEPQAQGVESVEFRVAGHEGSTPRALGKVASGGELSRIALAIAVTTSELGTTGTLIFDEVDAGVGGAVAQTVGQLMQRLGRDRQVLAVTHLAQVAAYADAHQVVAKAASNGITRSEVRPVDGDTRVTEIARMLGGQRSESALAHAREMIDTSRHAPPPRSPAGRRPTRP